MELLFTISTNLSPAGVSKAVVVWSSGLVVTWHRACDSGTNESLHPFACRNLSLQREMVWVEIADELRKKGHNFLDFFN